MVDNVDEYEDQERSKEEYMLLEYNRLKYIQAEDGQVLREVFMRILWSSEFVVRLLLSRWCIPSMVFYFGFIFSVASGSVSCSSLCVFSESSVK